MKKSELTEEERKHLEPHDITKIVKVGDIVSIHRDSYEFKNWWKVFVGVVTECSQWEKHGPLSTENHGSLTIKITDFKTRKPKTEYLKVGDDEHFCYWKWYETFEIVEQKEAE